jgi:bifunctional DNA-binding transcriptional regulator/antitoxin component of YhaV-PrlF toxin-antitoxin module
MARVKKQAPRRHTRISSKHQVTIPVSALREAGLKAGDRLVARVEGPGRVVLEREDDVIAEFAGMLTGAYEPNELETMRAEWD